MSRTYDPELPTRQKILEAIGDLNDGGPCPTLAEIGERVGGLDKSVVHYHIKLLAENGLVLYEPGKPRTIRLAPEEAQA